MLLSQINDYVSIQVNALFNCASAIHLDRDVTSNLFFKNSEFNTLLIMQEMRKILGTNPFIERAFYIVLPMENFIHILEQSMERISFLCWKTSIQMGFCNQTY